MHLLKPLVVSFAFLNIFSGYAFCDHSFTPPILDYWQDMIQSELDEVSTASMVLDEGTIETPGYLNSFNPSLISWQDGFLMSFRDDYYRSSSIGNEYIYDLIDSNLIIAKLDENLSWIPESEFRVHTYTQKAQDIRLFSHNDQLCVIYNDTDYEADSSRYDYGVPRRSIYTAKLDLVSQSLFDVQKKDFTPHWIEKNWTPFLGSINDRESLLYLYSIDPQCIFNDFGELVVNDSTSKFCNTWSSKWGPIRGGTPPVEVDQNTYLGFFHSSIFASEGKSEHGIYFMGAYTFSKDYPFKIRMISKIPLFKNSFYNANADTVSTIMPNRAVAFPCGLCKTVYDGKDALIVTYGSNDSACKYVIYDTKALLDSLENTD